MAFAPSNDTIISRPLDPPVFFPQERASWSKILPAALSYWKQVAKDGRIGNEIRAAAKQRIVYLSKLNEGRAASG